MAKLTTAEFIDAIKELSVLELNDLVKACEEEFWFAIIKIVAVIAMIVGGLAVIIFALPTASGIKASFANWFTLEGEIGRASCRERV